MEVVSSVSLVQGILDGMNRPLGLVPTMGSLHAGHLSLVRRAKKENASVAVTIFVNPVQFDNKNDYTEYPRNLEWDLKSLCHEGVDFVLTPQPDEVFPPGFDTWITPPSLAERLEGYSRPGHMRGVCTVVMKFFNLFRPDRSYFGMKDAQQLLVIEQLARDLNTGVEVVRVPTVREEDGLALSSRNVRLEPDQRRAASILHRALESARDRIGQNLLDASKIRGEIASIVALEPLAKLDYASVADAVTLEELDWIDRQVLVSLAVWFGSVRLIDNYFLEPPQS